MPFNHNAESHTPISDNTPQDLQQINAISQMLMRVRVRIEDSQDPITLAIGNQNIISLRRFLGTNPVTVLALMIALDKNDPRINACLTEFLNINFYDAHDHEGITPLHIAAYLGEKVLVALLLNSQVKIRQTKNNHLTALSVARDPQIIEVLQNIIARDGIYEGDDESEDEDDEDDEQNNNIQNNNLLANQALQPFPQQGLEAGPALYVRSPLSQEHLPHLFLEAQAQALLEQIKTPQLSSPSVN